MSQATTTTTADTNTNNKINSRTSYPERKVKLYDELTRLGQILQCYCIV